MNPHTCFSFKSLKENDKNSEIQQSPNHTIPDYFIYISKLFNLN